MILHLIQVSYTWSWSVIILCANLLRAVHGDFRVVLAFITSFVVIHSWIFSPTEFWNSVWRPHVCGVHIPNDICPLELQKFFLRTQSKTSRKLAPTTISPYNIRSLRCLYNTAEQQQTPRWLRNDVTCTRLS